MTISPKGISLLALWLCAAAGPAFAQARDCGAGIDRLAQQHDLATGAPLTGGSGQPATGTAPPATMESRGLTENQPVGGSHGAFTPPPPAAPSASAPIIGSNAPPSPPPPVAAAPNVAKSDLNAADRGRMEALLKAARDADRKGDAALCLDRLREAEAVVPGERRTR